MSDTCAVILNWNGSEDTVACLESLLAMDLRPESVVVVDNGSTDDSVSRLAEFARQRFGGVRVIGPDEDRERGDAALGDGSLAACTLLALPENLGFAGGVNAGLAYALHQGAHGFLWVLNNDVLLDRGCLAGLLEEARARPAAGIFGATVLRHADGRVECAGGCFTLPWATMVFPAYAGRDRQTVLRRPEPRLDYVLGACLLARREVFAAVGLFPRDTFLYYEEARFCLRAVRAGFRLAWARRAVVRHKGGQSLARAYPDAARRKTIANYHENLGALIFIREAYPGLLPLAAAFRVLGKLAVILARGEPYLAAPLWAACRDFLGGKAPSRPGAGPCPR